MRSIRAVALALLLFIYPILVLSAASIHYTETIHRVTTGQMFDETLFGSPIADSLGALGFLLLFASLTFHSVPVRLVSIAIFATGVALYIFGSDLLLVIGIATLPALAASLAVVATTKKRSEPFALGWIDANRIIAAFLIIVIILEIGAVARWIAQPFFPTDMYGDPSWSFAQLESSLFHTLGLLSPFIVAAITFSFFYKWFIPDVLKRMRQYARQSRQDSSAVPPVRFEGVADSKIQQTVRDRDASKYAKSGTPVVTAYAKRTSTVTVRNIHLMILSAALLLAPLLAIYPHLPGVNPVGSGVSTDEQYYMNWMSKLRADATATWTETISNAFAINKGDRPLTLLVILAIANLTGSPDLMVVRYLPVALAPMLILANYLFLRYSLRSEDQTQTKLYASIGAIFAAFSPQLVIGQYAGLLSNWMALVASYFAFYYLIKGWESQNRNQLVYSFSVLFTLLLVMMLVHLYTWANLLAIILLFAGVSFIFARKSVENSKIKVVVMLAIVAAAFLIDYAKSSYFATPTAAGSGSAIEGNIEPQDANGRWERLFFTLNTYVGGFLSNPVLLLPALLWMVRADLSRGIDRLLLVMFFIMAVPITFGSIEFQTRVLYNIPLHIPVLLLLFYGATKFKDRMMTSRYVLLMIAISLAMATYALRAMVNLYLELPDGYVLEDQFLLP